MIAIRYGVDVTLPFAGPPLRLLDPTATIDEAWLTIKREWAAPLDEAGPEPAALQLGIDATAQPQGQIVQPGDGFGAWALEFNLTATETAVNLAPEETDTNPDPRVLWYDVTLLLADGRTLRPIVGKVRMLPDVFAQVES